MDHSDVIRSVVEVGSLLDVLEQNGWRPWSGRTNLVEKSSSDRDEGDGNNPSPYRRVYSLDVLRSLRKTVGLGKGLNLTADTTRFVEDAQARLNARDCYQVESGGDGNNVVAFVDLMLPEEVLRGLGQCGFVRPTPVQFRAIPVGRMGVDLIAQAKSGTGKTCAFCVVAVEVAMRARQLGMSKPRVRRMVSVIVIAPTREIAQQIASVVSGIARFADLRIVCAVGGTPLKTDRVNLRRGCDILVGTPGRVEALIREDILEPSLVQLLVIDEADKLLDGTFNLTISDICQRLPASKQTAAFSATFPAELLAFLYRLMRDPHVVNLCGSETQEFPLQGTVLAQVKQSKIHVDGHDDPTDTLMACLTKITYFQCIVFCNDSIAGPRIATKIAREGIHCSYLRGSMAQTEREDAIRQMRDQHSHVLVATDLVARGVDLTGCDLVIHMDLPLESSTYLHRVGRAGRFGRHGQSIAIYHRSRDQVAVQSLERQLGFSLEERPDLCDIPDMVHSSSCLSSTPLYRAEPQSTVIQHQDVALDPQDSSEPWSELESNAYDAGYLQGQWAGYSAAWQILDQLFGLDSSTRPGG